MNRLNFSPPQDPLLPALAQAVRPDKLLGSLQAAARSLTGDSRIRLKSVGVELFHHKPFNNCRIVYRLKTAHEGDLVACAKLHPAVEKRQQVSGEKSCYLSDMNMTLRLLPEDPQLPGLRSILDPAWIEANRHLFEKPGELDGLRLRKKDIHIQVLNYRPRFRCLMKIETRYRAADSRRKLTHYAKVYHSFPSPEWPKSLQSLCYSAWSPHLILPAVTGWSMPEHLIVLRAASGSPVEEKITGDEYIVWMKKTAKALADFHGSPARIPARRCLQADLREAESCAVSLQKIDDLLGETAMRIYRLLVIRKRSVDSGKERQAEILVHGDFSHEQILVKNQKILILDYDHLAMGDGRCDLGNFAANLLEWAAAGNLARHRVRAALRVFFRTYLKVTERPYGADSLGWYTALSLLKLALRPLRRAEPDWKTRCLRILAAARNVMDGEWDDIFSQRGPQKAGYESRRINPDKEVSIPAYESTADRRIPCLLIKRHPVDTLKKIWPGKDDSWMLLFTRSGSAGKNVPAYWKIPVGGKSDFRPYFKDAKLGALTPALERKTAEKMLGAHWPGDFTLPSGSIIKKVRPRGYKPEHRCLLEYTLRNEKIQEEFTLFGKFYRSLEIAQKSNAHFLGIARRIADSGNPLLKAIPQSFLIPRWNAVFFPGVGKKSLFELLKEGEISSSARGSIPNQVRQIIKKIASGLNLFHSLDYNPGEKFSREDEIRAVERWTEAAGRVYPVLRYGFREALDLLENRGRRLKPSEFRLIHRDFYDKQILFSDSRVVFLDYDLLSRGDPALDVGNFSAHLILRGIQFHGDPGYYDPLRRLFVQSFEKNRGQEAGGGIRWYTASSLLRLAGVYLLRPGGKRYFRPLLGEFFKQLG